MLILLGLLPTAVTLWGQAALPRISFERFDRRAGLLSHYLTELLEDEHGFLWMGTEQDILRYDGYNFQPFTAQQDVLTARLRNGTHHGLWSLSIMGHLHRYEPQQERFVPQEPHWAGQPEPVMLYDLLELASGDLWVTTQDGQLCRYDPNTAVLTPFPLSRPDGAAAKASRLQTDAAGNLWVAGSDLFRLTPAGDTWKATLIPAIGPIDLFTLEVDPAGRVWLDGKDNQLVRYDPSSGRVQRFDLSPPGGVPSQPFQIKDLFFAADGWVWVGTNFNGITLLEPETGRTRLLTYDRNDPQTLSSNSIQCILRDRSGTIWISSWGGGLDRFRPANQFFRHYRSLPNDPTTLSHPEPNCFYAAPDGTVWIGTRDGLNRFDPATGQIESFFLPLALTGNREVTIYALASDAEAPGHFWVGTSIGLFRFTEQTGRFVRWTPRQADSQPLARGIVYHLLRDEAGTLWAIVFGHQGIGYRLFRYAPATGTFNTVDPLAGRHPDRSEVIFHANPQGTLWIDTPDSVFYAYDLPRGRLTPYVLSSQDATGFNPARIGHAVRDRSGQLWFGNQSGLFRLLPAEPGQPARFRHYTEANGLVDRSISSMLLDGRDRLWLATSSGLSCFDLATETFYNFRSRDGLQADEFNYNAAYTHPGTGAIYLGGVNGFNVFRPDHLPIDTVPPQIMLTRLEVLRGDTMEALPVFTADYTPRTALELTATEKIVRFEFAALHFADPDRNQYAYLLEGFDTDWRYVGERREATYTNLDPGTYRLRVKAANKDGVWNETGATLELRVLPPWWATRWAYLLYAITLGSAATWLYRTQQRRRRIRAEAERIKELDRFKNQFYTNITHEFRTPLTVILGMVRQLRDYPERYLDSGTRLIERNGRQLLGLINQLLDLSKLENQALPINWQRGDIVPYLSYLTESFASYAAERGLDLRFSAEPAQLDMDYDPEQLQQIMTNLIGNALKFTPSGGQVGVHLRATETQLTITVRDTGVGIPAADLPYIFDRFYQVNRQRNPLGGGTGIGLAHTRSLVQLMGGEISVTSSPDSGSTFRVQLPIHREAPLADAPRTGAAPTLPLPVDKTPGAAGDDGDAATRPEVLLIEDNADVITYLKTCLEPHYRCAEANNGQAGIDRALESVPDLIISDVMMPERDGFEVCDMLKNDPRTSHIPLILLTARADAASRIAGLRRGADVYLAKPFDKTELLVQIDRLLQRQRQLAAYFSRQLQHPRAEPPPTGLTTEELAPENSFVRRVRETVAEHYADENFALPELCKAIGMSRSQLYRKLRALCGISPSEFIRTYRLERARELLADSELNVSEVAWQVGYRDPSYFTKSFQDAFGYLPSANDSPKQEA
jgi:signal transduction histidine kinase/ligand-binding sensor domain-containing protein/CheY-like chemotaxis protein/AraC-like DNA-binding protein